MTVVMALFLALLVGPSAWGQIRPVILVTEREARLPDAAAPPYEDFLKQRGLFDSFRQFSTPKAPEPPRGPEIALIRPRDGATYTGTLDIEGRFIPRAAPGDLSTLNFRDVYVWG